MTCTNLAGLATRAIPRPLASDRPHPTARQVGRLRDLLWLNLSEAGHPVATIAALFRCSTRAVLLGIDRGRALREEVARALGDR